MENCFTPILHGLPPHFVRFFSPLVVGCAAGSVFLKVGSYNQLFAPSAESGIPSTYHGSSF